MAMLKDEVAIIKAVCMKIDEESVLLATLQYHTERNDMGKIDHEKSKYRWVARAIKELDFKDEIAKLNDDSIALQKHRWHNDPDPWFICVNNGNTNKDAARFYATKLARVKSWEDGQKQLKGFQSKTSTRDEGYNSNAAYATDDYTTENGDKVDLTNKEQLLAHLGQTLYRNQVMKSKSSNKIVTN